MVDYQPRIGILFSLVFSLTLVSCTYHRYGRDTHHAVFHLDLTGEERQQLQKGGELRKTWFAFADDQGYDSGALVVKKVKQRAKYDFLHTGKWSSVHNVVIQRDSFQTRVEDWYDTLGNQVSHAIYLRKSKELPWQLFQKSFTRQDSVFGPVLVLDNFHLSGQPRGHLEWHQPHFHQKGSHRKKHYIFLPERSQYWDEQGKAISRRTYNRSVIVWKQKVGRMGTSTF